LTRDGIPTEVDLPLLKRHVNNTWVWCASALLPEGPTREVTWYWRKRFRRDRAPWLTTGSPNLQMGTYRDWQTALPLLLCHKLVGYASGSRKDARKLLKAVRYLGKKRAHGHGRIIGLDIDEVEHDRCLSIEDRAARWLPDSNGIRLVRPRPPYWHIHGAVKCCEIGDRVNVV
jgi:hypothetical protein